MKVAARLGEIRDRLDGVTILNSDAVEIIKQYDGPQTFFYLDPPYPTEWKFDADKGKAGGGADSSKWQGKDLHKLLDTLKSVRGKFILSLEAEIARVIPKEFQITKVNVARQMALGPEGKLRQDPEILVSNFDMHVVKSQPDAHTSLDDVINITKSQGEQRLVTTVNMVPNKVDGEGHWQTKETIEEVANNFMLKEIPIWSEHQKATQGVFPVQSWTLPSDWDFKDYQGNERHLPEGTWLTTLWVENDAEWEKVKKGDYVGTSIRGFSRRRPGSPPASERTGTGS
jgi:DNA adenine methylase